MEGWKEVLRFPLTSAISTLEFDNQSNLLWTGDNNGYLNSFTPMNYNEQLALYPYTKFRSNIQPVTQIINSTNKIYSLSKDNININNKRGIPLQNINKTVNPHYESFSCMALNDLSNEMIIGKAQGLFKINLADPSSFESFQYNKDVCFIGQQSKFWTLGTLNGGVDLFDQNSNRIIKEFTGHNDGLSDMDINGNYLVTSGYSLRHNTFFVDPLINLYDLRMMKLLSPIPFSFGPSFVKFHPKLPNLIMIGSKSGNLQFLDIFDQSKFQLYQIDLVSNTNYISNLKFSDNGEFITMNDSYNNLILWNFNDSQKFVNFPMELDGITLTEEPIRNFPVDDTNIPLNSVGMPFYKDLLLSNYGSNLIFTKETSKLPLSYDENIPYLKFMENKYDSNFNKYYPLNKTNAEAIPFISESNGKFDDSSITRIPNCYMKLLIKYSKFGIEDFNFDLFNKTNYSGLENNLDNSYLNSILQLYKYQTDFHNVILKNLFNEWLPNDEETILQKKNFKGSSLLNELGYLFDMLDKARGRNVKISNFSEFFNTMAPPELLNFDDLKSVNSQHLKNMIITFNSFFLAKLMDDFHYQNSFLKELGSIILIKYVSGNQIKAVTNINLYPIMNKNFNLIDFLNVSFTHVVEVPKILSINVNLNNRDFKSLRSDWLCEFIHTEITSNFIIFSDKPKNFKSYKLLGYVAEINNGPETSIGNHNLITFITINNKWYLFNDFLVQEINKSEVMDFQKDNKKPLVLLYETYDKDHEPLHLITPQEYRHINDDILYRDHFALSIRKDYIKQYQLLSRSNPPRPGSLIAIDAEFVILEDEKFEVRSNVRNLIQPKKLSLARISVIDQQETPFIDDYIIHTQPIKDYITSFSGIEPGDLDPLSSNKNLVTFQTSYRRLWLLLNLGCVFIGHGLQNDFRTINIHVPKEQIRDTSELFFLPDYKRKLSLKFLSYVVLKENVQVGNHDSIEDSRYALKLYKKYQELESSGRIQDTLDDIYYEGLKMKFKVPE